MTSPLRWLRDALGVAVASAALFSAVIAVDVWLGYRALVREPPGEEIRGVHVADLRLGWALEKGGAGIHRSEGNFDVRYGIDERGFRRVANRGEPVRRLFVFGDSFTFGHGVDDGSTWTSVLASRLLRPGEHVVNAGVMGYGITQMLQRLADLEPEIEPGDLVLFAPTSDDFVRTYDWFTYPSRHLLRRSKGEVATFPDLRDGRLVTADLDTRWNRMKALLFHAKLTGPAFERIFHALEGVDPARDGRAAIAMAREIAARRGARFALVVLPYPRECSNGAYDVDVSALGPIDLMPAFPSSPEETARIHFPRDPHWNPLCHEIAARGIAQALLADGDLAPDELASPDALVGHAAAADAR
jgi:GDSL-like lipase/acylhydrolase family protein